MTVYVYIYIYIERERGRCVYIYIYIYMYIHISLRDPTPGRPRSLGLHEGVQGVPRDPRYYLSTPGYSRSSRVPRDPDTIYQYLVIPEFRGSQGIPDTISRPPKGSQIPPESLIIVLYIKLYIYNDDNNNGHYI